MTKREFSHPTRKWPRGPISLRSYLWTPAEFFRVEAASPHPEADPRRRNSPLSTSGTRPSYLRRRCGTNQRGRLDKSARSSKIDHCLRRPAGPQTASQRHPPRPLFDNRSGCSRPSRQWFRMPCRACWASAKFRSPAPQFSLIQGHRHLQTVLDEYVEDYNRHRPHRGPDLSPADPVPRVQATTGTVIRQPRRGGLINEYQRRAA